MRYFLLLSYLALLLAGSVAEAANEVALLPHVVNNVALKAVKSTAYTTVVRDGFTTPGDGGDAVYVSSNLACTLNAGAGDNGYQVKPTNGPGCWNLIESPLMNRMIWGISAQPTFYVTAAGNNYSGANSCLLVADPCLTIAQASQQYYKFPWYGASEKVSIGAGTWNESISISQGLIPAAGLGTVTSLPALYVVGAGSGSTTLTGDGVQCGTVIASNPGAQITIQAMTITATRAACQSGVYANLGGIVNTWTDIKYGAANQMHMIVEENNSFIGIWADYTITGSANYHWGAGAGGQILYYPANVIDANGVTITLTGTPAFSQFALIQSGGSVQLQPDTTFSGSATGGQFLVQSGGRIVSTAIGATPIPGNAPGFIFEGATVYPEAKLVRTNNTVVSGGGLGTGTIAVTTNNSDSMFVTLSPTGAPGALGSFTVTLGSRREYDNGNGIPCVASLSPASAGWPGTATITSVNPNTSANPPTVGVTWNTNGAALAAGSTYAVSIMCR